jgi:V8-like Glu-specific endopeptidase
MVAGAALALIPVSTTAADSAPFSLGTPAGTPFRGTPAVGALLVTSHGKLRHFCTAAVVRSPHQNLAITAAHCMLGKQLGLRGNVTFAPGYHDGRFPYGRWPVLSEIVDANWRKHHDANDDVAFLVIGPSGNRIQRRTGAESVTTSYQLPELVRVIGYPDGASEPITCTALARALHKAGLHQLVFICGGYTNGTSGGPFLMNVSHRTGDGDVIGVIGGYQEGGDSPSISYSARFLRNIAALYSLATS